MAKIKFDHAVIYNGVFYPADTEIEVIEPEKEPDEKQGEEPEKEPDEEVVTENDNRTGKNTKSRNKSDN